MLKASASRSVGNNDEDDEEELCKMANKISVKTDQNLTVKSCLYVRCGTRRAKTEQNKSNIMCHGAFARQVWDQTAQNDPAKSHNTPASGMWLTLSVSLWTPCISRSSASITVQSTESYYGFD